MAHKEINLVALRAGKRLTVRQAAEQIGIPFSTLHRLERRAAEPTLESAKRIADFYGLEVFAIWPVEKLPKERAA